MASTFSLEEFTSDKYTLGGKILVTVFSQTFPLKNPKVSLKDEEFEDRCKRKEKDQYGGKRDVDFGKLKELFDMKTTFQVKYLSSKSFEEVKDYLEKLDSKEKYSCYCFVFLTYIESKEEKLHFNHEDFNKGIVPEADIFDEVKKINAARGKPKIFLIQADDLSLIKPEQKPKGPTPVSARATIKIPQDADRLVIKSTIPQYIANLGSDLLDNKAKNPNPSFLIQAFVDAMIDNEKKNDKKEDLLSLSTKINEKVAALVAQTGHERVGDMTVPLVTSTLTKLLYL